MDVDHPDERIHSSTAAGAEIYMQRAQNHNICLMTDQTAEMHQQTPFSRIFGSWRVVTGMSHAARPCCAGPDSFKIHRRYRGRVRRCASGTAGQPDNAIHDWPISMRFFCAPRSAVRQSPRILNRQRRPHGAVFRVKRRGIARISWRAEKPAAEIVRRVKLAR